MGCLCSVYRRSDAMPVDPKRAGLSEAGSLRSVSFAASGSLSPLQYQKVRIRAGAIIGRWVSPSSQAEIVANSVGRTPPSKLGMGAWVSEVPPSASTCQGRSRISTVVFPHQMLHAHGPNPWAQELPDDLRTSHGVASHIRPPSTVHP